MKHVLVAQELDITNLEDHVESETMASILENLCGLLLLWTEGWDDTLVGEARKRLDVVWIPLGVDTAVLAGLEVEDRSLDVWLLAVRHLALAVEVPDWLSEELGNVWTLLLEGIPDMVGGDNVRLSTLKCTGNAEKTNNVRIVRVEELSGVGPVDTDTVNGLWIITKVLDVAKYVTSAILTDEVSKVCSQAHVSYGRLVVTPLLNWETFEKDESLTIEDLVFDRCQKLGKIWEWEVALQSSLANANIDL